MSKTLKEVDYLISWGRKEILYDLEKLVSRWKEEIKWMREGYTELDKDTPLCMLMDLQKVQGAAQSSVQSSQMQQQQVIAMAQHSMMGGALNAAMADLGMMSKMGSGVGNIMRGVITGVR